jgi:uncharacterized protein YggE
MENCFWSKTFAFILVLCLTALSAAAQGERQPSISVQGSADVKVVPDEVFIALGVETSDPNLTASKTQNDERVKKLLALTKEMSIDSRYVQTDFISIEPWDHQLNDEKRTVRLEYRVRKNIAVTLKDVPRFEELLSRALEAGANHVHGIQFRTTALRKHRDHARGMALQAAKEKATLLAGKLGRQVGPAVQISEYGGGLYSHYGWWGQGSSYGSSNAMAQVSSQSGNAADADGTIALGQITVTASVSVTFALR